MCQVRPKKYFINFNTFCEFVLVLQNNFSHSTLNRVKCLNKVFLTFCLKQN